MSTSSQELRPLRRRSVVDEAYEALRAQILHGSWAAGAKLPSEQAIGQDLGVSRNSVREALNRLASAGLIEIQHGGAKRVLEWRDHAGLEVLADLVVTPAGGVDPAAVRAVTELRGAVAPDAARLAALRWSGVRGERLVRLAHDLDPASELEPLLEATLEWWTELVLASGNLAYRLAFNTLCSTYREGRPLLIQVIQDELRAVERYRAVSLAVFARNPEGARHACRGLVALGGDAIDAALAFFEEDPS